MEKNREIIIMVDDDITNLTVARNNLAGTYKVLTAPSGHKLFLLLEKVIPALILLDIEMPEMDGYEVMEKLKENRKTADIPVIFLTSKIDPESEIKGLNLGAVDYITKPFSRDLLIKRIDLHILLERQRNELLRHNRNLESEIDKKAKTVIELQNAILITISELVECRDNVTGGHIERTQHYLGLMIDFLMEHDVYTEELETWDMDLLVMSSQLHDVGKISIRDDILMKPGKLTADEFEEMKSHTSHGVDIIKRVASCTTESEFLRYAEVFADSHHERWDGNGYPNGLKGDEIPLQGRLMALVDVYDALTNDRPYKKAFSHESSVNIIKNESGVRFDPKIVDVFLKHEQEFSPDIINKRKYNAQYDNLESTLNMVSNLLSTRSDDENDHAGKIKVYLDIFYDALLSDERYCKEVSAWDKDIFLVSAQLHDVGKIAVSDNILNKAGELSDDEFDSIRSHPSFGVEVVEQIKESVGSDKLLYHAETMAGSHHEKWDGTGYPLGLKGDDIPLQGRIMALVDVYSALTADRPHRKKMDHEEALEIIIKDRGISFDPALVDVFLECAKGFDDGSM